MQSPLFVCQFVAFLCLFLVAGFSPLGGVLAQPSNSTQSLNVGGGDEVAVPEDMVDRLASLLTESMDENRDGTVTQMEMNAFFAQFQESGFLPAQNISIAKLLQHTQGVTKDADADGDARITVQEMKQVLRKGKEESLKLADSEKGLALAPGQLSSFDFDASFQYILERSTEEQQKKNATEIVVAATPAVLAKRGLDDVVDKVKDAAGKAKDKLFPHRRKPATNPIHRGFQKFEAKIVDPIKKEAKQAGRTLGRGWNHLERGTKRVGRAIVYPREAWRDFSRWRAARRVKKMSKRPFHLLGKFMASLWQLIKMSALPVLVLGGFALVGYLLFVLVQWAANPQQLPAPLLAIKNWFTSSGGRKEGSDSESQKLASWSAAPGSTFQQCATTWSVPFLATVWFAM